MARSRFLRRTALLMTSTSSLVAVALAFVLIGSVALRMVDKPSRVRIAVGPADTADGKFGDALHRELPKGFGSTDVRLVRGSTLEEVAAAVDNNKAELAIVRTDVAVPKQAGTMLIVHRDAALFLALPGSKIDGIADLDGKRIAVVPGGNANDALVDAVLTRYGVDDDTAKRIPLSPNSLAEAVTKKEIDAAVVFGAVGSDLLTNAVSAMTVGDKSPTFLELKNADAFEQSSHGFVKVTIPTGLFPGSPPLPEEDVETIGVDYQLVARHDMSDASVGMLTRTILAMRRLLAETAPIAEFMQAPDTEKGSRYPLHAGATAFFEDNEKTFMDRYGDWFYIIAMVLGGVGSALASMVASLQARSRRRAMGVIDELATMRRRAAECTDQSALRALDRDVSELALNALYRAREGRFDQAGVEILRLAVEETRRTITRRLAELRSGSPAASDAPQAAVAQGAT